MKEYLKNTWATYAISLVLSFMLFLFEPINMFASNTSDFWFDLKTLLIPSFLLFGLSIAGFIILINIVYFINKKVFKVLSAMEFIGFICTYIQGNYLVGKLPVLDGTPIDWNGYTVQNIISIVIWLVVIIGTIIIVKKIKLANYLKYAGYISLAVFAMLSVSLISVVTTSEGLGDKTVNTQATFKEYNKYSTDKNFIILLVDAIDSRSFEKSLTSNSEFKNMFNDFTYYPDTMSYYPFTHESIPQILSGKIFENDRELSDYTTKSLKESYLFNTLKDKGYALNMYTRNVPFLDEQALELNNFVLTSDTSSLGKKKFMKQELKYILFRYLPYGLKKYSKIETMDFGLASLSTTGEEFYYESNGIFNDLAVNNDIELTDQKYFKFYHIDGAHIPFEFDKTLNYNEKATYDTEVDGCLTIVNNYLKYLKKNKIYDNSVIMIMADHGYNGNTHIGRQNPMLLIKGINEKHKYTKSDIPVSYIDLDKIYEDLINDKKSDELLKDIDKNRERKYILYSADTRNNMVEYGNKDKAWETDKMYKTGKEYNR